MAWPITTQIGYGYARCWFFDKSAESDFFKKSGTHFRDNIQRFDVIPAANSMTIRSGLD